MSFLKQQHIDQIFFNINTNQSFDFQTEKWDLSIDFIPERLPLTIDISTLGFKLSTGNFDLPLTRSNYDFNRQIFSAICSEYIAMTESSIRANLRKDSKLDGVIVEGKTPDLVFYGSQMNRGLGTAIEFKSSLASYTPEMAVEMIESLKEIYGSKFENVILIFTKLDADFPSKFGDNPRFASFYSFILSQFIEFGSKVSGRRVMQSDWSRPFDHLFKQTEKMNINFGPSAVKEIADYKDKEFAMELIDLMEAGEPFFDENYLIQSEAAKVMFEPITSRKPNIWSPHIYDRDKNREKTQGSDFGHRSLFMADFPLHKDLLWSDSAARDNLENLVQALMEQLRVWKMLGIPDSENVYAASVKVALKTIKNYVPNQEIFDGLKATQREIAWKKTEANKSKIDAISRRDLEAEIATLESAADVTRKELMAKFPDLNVSKSGYVRMPLDSNVKYFTGIDRKLEKFTKPEVDHVDIATAHFDFNKLISTFKKAPKFNFDTKDFYPKNTSINDQCNDLLKVSKIRLEQIMNTPMFGYLYWLQKMYRGYLTQFPKLASKKVQNSDFGFYAVPEIPIFVVASAPPREITTGSIVTFAFVKKDTPVPEGYHEQLVINFNHEADIWISKPFRINLKFMERFEELFAAWVSLQIMGMEYDIDIINNGLFNSMFLRYSRQLNHVSDALYLLMKNAINYGTIGKKEYPKKFAELEARDIRVACIIRNLVSGYEGFAKRMRTYNESANNELFDQVDPVFKIHHKSIQTFLLVTYIKQIYIKNDGYDEDWIGYDFFMKEAEHQEEYENSLFNEKAWDFRHNMTMQEFIKRLFHEDGSMEKVAYHNRSCKYLIRKLFEQALEKKSTINSADNFVEELADETVVNSRVNMYDDFMFEDLKKKKKEKVLGEGVASKYKGIQSIQQAEAIQIEILKFKEFAEKHLGVPHDKISNYNPTVSDLLIYELNTYPNHAVLTVKVKEQKGYAKRIFFIQTVDNRNLNHLLDESLNNLLKNVKEDMIVIPGDFKLVDLEKKMAALGFEVTKGLVLTGDQTKFGDKYPLQTFHIMIDTLWELGYYNEPQRNLFREAISRLQGRVTLAPPNSNNLLKSLESIKKADRKKMTNLINGRSQKVAKKALKLSEVTGKADIWSAFLNDAAQGKNGVPPALFENLAISKMLGFVLGVFNKLGSTYSSAHFLAMDIFFNEIGLKDVIKGATHSDDSIKFVAIPAISQLDLTKAKLTDLWAALRSGFKLKSNPNQRHVVLIDPNQEKPVMMSGDVMVKLAALLDLFTPRLVGQNPSLTKTAYGPSGEVLQVFAIFGAMIPPLMRYLAALGADLPGKSPSLDLSSAVGRIHNAFINGASVQLINDLLIVINWFVFQRYGIEPNSYVDINRKVPEFGGFNYFYPPLLFEQGFAANEVRLHSLALSGDDMVRNQMLIFMDTDEYLIQNDIFDFSNDREDENTETSINISSESFKGVISSRISLEINYSRNLKAQYSFFALFNKLIADINVEALNYRNRNLITQEAYEAFLNAKKPGQKVKILKTALLTRILTKTGGFLEKIVVFLAKYLSKAFQESYLRIPEGVMLVNRLGYFKRLFSNPFSQKMRSFDSKFDKPRYFVKELWDLAIETSRSGDYPKSILNKNFLVEVQGLWTNLMLPIFNMKVEYTGFRSKQIDKDIDMRWRKLEPITNKALVNIPTNTVIALAIEKRQFRVPFDELPTVLNEPWLVNNKAAKDTLDSFMRLIDNLDFKIFDIQKHVNILNKLFLNHGVTSIARISRSNNVPLQAMVFDNLSALSWTTGKMIIPELTGLKVVEKRDLIDSQKAKILAVATSVAGITGFNVKDIKAFDTITERNIDLPELAVSLKRSIIESFTPSLGVFNNWMAATIYELSAIKRGNVKFWRANKNTPPNKKFYAIFNNNHFYYLKMLPRVNDSGLPLFKGFTTNRNPNEVAFFFFMISFFLIRKEMRMHTLKQLEAYTDRDKFKGAFWVDKDEVLSWADNKGNRKIKLVTNEDASNDLRGIDESIFEDLSFKIFPLKSKKDNPTPYVVTTWTVNKLPTEVTFVVPSGNFTDSVLEQNFAESLEFTNITVYGRKNSEWLPLSDGISHNPISLRLMILYAVLRKHFGLDLEFIDPFALKLTVSQWTDFHKFLFYAGITDQNFKDILTINLDDVVSGGITAKEAEDTNKNLKIQDVSLQKLTLFLIDKANDFLDKYPNSKEILVFFTVQQGVVSRRNPAFMTESQLLHFVSNWFTKSTAGDVKELLRRRNIRDFQNKFQGFRWGQPQGLSTSYFVNLVNMLDPSLVDVARNVIKPTFTAYWHGNAAAFVRDLLKLSNSKILNDALNNSIKFMSMMP